MKSGRPFMPAKWPILIEQDTSSAYFVAVRLLILLMALQTVRISS